jgi:hypothetical protein
MSGGRKESECLWFNKHNVQKDKEQKNKEKDELYINTTGQRNNKITNRQIKKSTNQRKSTTEQQT